MARADQARRALEVARAGRADTVLRAPFDAVVNTVEVQGFANVPAGQPIVTLYEEGGFEAPVLVSYEVASALTLGDPAEVVPADRPVMAVPGAVSEIARRAPAVSSFPVVVTLEETDAGLRSGMAVEALLDLPWRTGPRAWPCRSRRSPSSARRRWRGRPRTASTSSSGRPRERPAPPSRAGWRSPRSTTTGSSSPTGSPRASASSPRA